MTFLNKFILVIGVFHVSRGCDKGWVPYNDHCYFVSQQKVTFHKALAECNGMAAWMAATETVEESDWLRLHLTLIKSDHVYIGGTDMLEDGIWRWVKSGKEFNINHWHKGEPNGKKTENCLVGTKDAQFTWTDISCTGKYGFVCEKNDTYERREKKRGCFSHCC